MPRISPDSAAQSAYCLDASERFLVAIGLGVSWVGDTGPREWGPERGRALPFGRLGERTGLRPSDAQLCVVPADSEAYPANSRHLSRPQHPRRETGQFLPLASQRDRYIAAMRLPGCEKADKDRGDVHPNGGATEIEGGLANPTQSFWRIETCSLHVL